MLNNTLTNSSLKYVQEMKGSGSGNRYVIRRIREWVVKLEACHRINTSTMIGACCRSRNAGNWTWRRISFLFGFSLSPSLFWEWTERCRLTDRVTRDHVSEKFARGLHPISKNFLAILEVQGLQTKQCRK